MNKLQSLKSALIDADRRFEIAICKMSAITDRIHELEVQRNLALRKEFMKNNSIKGHDTINADKESVQVYEEIIQDYRSMSRRKNELEEERNYYVKEIEKEEKE